MATPNAVGNFRDSFDIDVVRHEYLVARWAATLTGNGIDSVRFKGSLVLPDYRLMSAPGDLRSKLTLNRFSSSDVTRAFFLLDLSSILGKP